MTVQIRRNTQRRAPTVRAPSGRESATDRAAAVDNPDRRSPLDRSGERRLGRAARRADQRQAVPAAVELPARIRRLVDEAVLVSAAPAAAARARGGRGAARRPPRGRSEPGKLGERIRERTGGNPFFIEEVVQSLAESGSLEGTKGHHTLVRSIETIDIPSLFRRCLLPGSTGSRSGRSNSCRRQR